MESYDPSAYRRRKEFLSSYEQSATVSGSGSSSTMSLSKFIQLMTETEIDGPYDLNDPHLGGKYLGSGAQFDVFGSQHLALASFPVFDQPYVTFMPRSRKMVWTTVAIKRARFTLAVEDSYISGSSSQSSSFRVGFGTPSQLRAFELEVLALCHDSIRNHRNIVKLLAWGFAMPDEHQKVEPLSPVLILEHGNCSLRAFLTKDKGTVPHQVLQKLALDTAEGLSALHASGIVHGDLKTDNALIFPDKEGPFFCIAKLSDFGLSVFGQSETERIYNLGTPGWQAPEFSDDNGVSTDMLVKSDYYSLGLLILSIVLARGAPPLRSLSDYLALEFAKESLSKSTLPPSASDRIYAVLEDLLQPDPFDRALDLENTCHLLKQVDQEPFDSHGAWVGDLFNDTTPWGEISSKTGSALILGALTRDSSRNRRNHKLSLNRTVEKEEFVIYSWSEIYKFLRELQTDSYPKYLKIVKHYIEGIEEVIFDHSQDQNFSMDIVGQEIAGYELLGIAFSCHSFPLRILDRFPRLNSTSIMEHRKYRRSRGACAAIAAAKGYFPAQAVAAQLLRNTNSRLLETVLSKDEVWQWNAVSTGYILAWGFADEHPEENALALQHFRMLGGYNTHYVYMEAGIYMDYDTSGLLRNPLGWLSTYPLHHAATLGNIEEVEDLVARGYKINSLDASGETALQRACMAGASASVRYLIRSGADPTIKSKNFGTVPLHWLFVFEPKEVREIAILLTTKTKSVLNELSGGIEAFHFPFRWPVGTPLEWAILSNRHEAVNTLLELGSTLDSISDFFPGPILWGNRVDGITPSNGSSVGIPFYAWIYGPIIQFRLPAIQKSIVYKTQLGTLIVWKHQWASKAALNLHLRVYYGSLIIAAVAEDDFAAVKRLVDAGRDVNIRDPKSGKTSLITAIRQNNQDIVRLLLDNGARLDEAPIHRPLDKEENSTYHPNQASPLQHAANLGNLEIVKLLLERGADVNAARSNWISSVPGEGLGSALVEATSRVDKPMVELLLEYGADLELQASVGPFFGTALYTAAGKSLELVELFLERGANPNTQCRDGTALHSAVRAKSVKIARLLLDKGADPNIQGPDGTVIKLAASPGGSIAIILELIELLLARGADVTMKSRKGSVLRAAASTGSDAVVKRLLDAGALVNDGPNSSALQAVISITEGVGLIKLLLDHGADPDLGTFGGALEMAVQYSDEKQVELLLRRGANPNAQGGDFGNVLKRALSPKTKVAWGLAGQKLDKVATENGAEPSEKEERYGSEKIIQMLLDWGAQDETEPKRWRLMTDELATLPLSLSDILRARFLLARCFDRYARQPCGSLNPVNLANRVLGFARYWLAELSERQDKIEVSKDTADAPYLQVKIKTWLSPNARVCRVVFRIGTRDEEAIKRPEIDRSGPFENSNTWFEVGVRLPNSGPAISGRARLVIQKNFCGSLKTRTHHITWDINDSDLKVSSFVASLQPGDVMDIFAKTSTHLYPNYVNSMEVITYYTHVSSPSYQVLNIRNGSNTDTNRHTGTISSRREDPYFA